MRSLRRRYRMAVRHRDKPALVFDVDDTALSTFDMEAGTMHFLPSP